MPILYVPKGRAREYAPLAINHYSGCSHGCLYCYVPTIPPWKFKQNCRMNFHTSPKPRKNVMQLLEKDLKRSPGNGQLVMLSFTTDPYQPINNKHRLTRNIISLLHDYGYNVQCLTKGGKRALYDLDVFCQNDAFATTMTCLDNDESLYWEPMAALPKERVETIEAFYSKAVQTWVSLEPVLNPKTALEIIRQTHEFTNLYKIGKLNHHQLANEIDWALFAHRAIDLCESLSQPYYIKNDLAAFIPIEDLGPYHITVEGLERHSLVQFQHQHTDDQAAHKQLSLFHIQ